MVASCLCQLLGVRHLQCLNMSWSKVHHQTVLMWQLSNVETPKRAAALSSLMQQMDSEHLHLYDLSVRLINCIETTKEKTCLLRSEAVRIPAHSLH